MLEPDARLTYTLHPHQISPLGRVEWEWQSGKNNVAAIDELLLVRSGCQIENEIITVGSHRLRVLDKRYLGRCWLVTPDGYKARLLKVTYSFKCAFEWFYHRLMLTLAIWGLADHTPGMIPSWRDIRIIKRLINGL